MLSPTFLPRKIHPENLKGAMFVGRLLVMSENEVFCVQIFYFVRKDEILKRLFAELRIISFDDELICTQMRDRRLTNPRIAYKAVRYFHFTLRGDGDVPVIIRKSEILMNPFAGLRINL